MPYSSTIFREKAVFTPLFSGLTSCSPSITA